MERAKPTIRSDWTVKGWKELVVQLFSKAGEDNLPRLASSFSFFALLSLAPFLVFATTAAGFVLGSGGTTDHLLKQAATLAGPQVKDYLAVVIASSQHKGTGVVATILSLGVTFWGASNLFMGLDDAVSTIWKIKAQGPALKNLIGVRILAFLSVLIFGGIIVGWLILDSVLTWVGRHTYVPFTGVSFAATILFLTLAFGVAIKALPRHRLAWRDVWPGAIFTALMLAFLKLLLSLYFSHMAGVYSAAGGVVILLLWLYYSALIYFFGIELTYVYAHRYGSRTGVEEREHQDLEPVNELKASSKPDTASAG